MSARCGGRRRDHPDDAGSLGLHPITPWRQRDAGSPSRRTRHRARRGPADQVVPPGRGGRVGELLRLVEACWQLLTTVEAIIVAELMRDRAQERTNGRRGYMVQHDLIESGAKAA